MYCSRRLYKGNAYEICLPIADTGITMVRFYTRGDIILEKEPETTGDSMCFSFTEEDLASLEDGVLRYGYDDFDTNSPYVVVTPGDYSGSTLDDLLEDAFDSGYTAGQEDCSGGSCDYAYESGYTGGYESGYTDGQADCSGSSCNIQESRMFAYGGPGSRATFDEQTKQYIGEKTIIPYPDYDCMGQVALYVNIDATDAINYGYASGYSAGQQDCSGGTCEGVWESGYTSGFTDGVESVPAEPLRETITENGDYAYAPLEGYYRSVHLTVDVPQTGYTQEDLDNAFASGYSAGYDSGYTDGIEACSGSPEPVYSAMPLTMEIISPGYILYKDGSQTGYFSGATISYSMDSGVTWTTISGLTGGTQIQVSSGDTVMFKGDNATYGTNGLGFLGFSNSTAGFKVYGNIMSLIDSQGFISATTLSSQWTFAHLFANCTGLTDASNLVLPATSLSFGCYEQLFLQCTNLVSAPELPATVLSPYCYELMFGFTNLIEAPVLCATTLTDHCYFAMFRFCGSLQKVVSYATDISANDCTVDWLKGVPAEGTFEKAPGMTSWPSGSAGIPTGWTVVDAT